MRLLKTNQEQKLKQEIIALTRLASNDKIKTQLWFKIRNTIRAKQKQLESLGV